MKRIMILPSPRFVNGHIKKFRTENYIFFVVFNVFKFFNIILILYLAEYR